MDIVSARLARRATGITLAVCLVGSSLTACTPKPKSAQPVAEEFFHNVAAQDFDAAAQLTDQDDSARELLSRSWEGLQAEGLDVSLNKVDAKDTVATAKYTLTWKLPKDRTLSYDTSMTLNRINDQWTIRWQPAAVHPKLAANQHLELRAINAERASVVSSDGAEVLVPGVQYRLIADTQHIIDKAATAQTIATHLRAARAADETVPELSASDIQQALETNRGSYSLAVVNERAGDSIKQALAGVSGIRLNKEAAMVNKDPNFAPDVIRRVSSLVNDQLAGANGWSVDAVTQDGVSMQTIERHAPQVAPAIRISLNHNVQVAAERAVNLRKDKQSMLVAIRPSTGEILAIAQSDLADKQGDLALNGQYPPGSTFKIVTASAGIQDQGLNADSIVPCPGTMNIYGRTVTNYNGFSLGNVPLEKAFARSCNTTFANISEQLNKGQLKEIGRDFGIGIDYDIPGLNTLTGSIPQGDTELARTEAGYGQGEVLVSPFGMALVSATAAAGKTPTPTLVSGTTTKVSGTADGLKPETVEQLRRLMGAVTAPGGTAAGMRAGGKIFGKTGEAEINGGSHAWFTGYRDDIAFASLVVLGGGSEASVAVVDNFFTTLDDLNAGIAVSQ